MELSTKTPRIEVVDALRGFAVMAILLVHNLEHFIFPVYPESSPEWLTILDAGVFNATFSLFAGKSYAIFALLFGFTFYIQSHNQQLKGKDFGYRFLWRMVHALDNERNRRNLPFAYILYEQVARRRHMVKVSARCGAHNVGGAYCGSYGKHHTRLERVGLFRHSAKFYGADLPAVFRTVVLFVSARGMGLFTSCKDILNFTSRRYFYEQKKFKVGALAYAHGAYMGNGVHRTKKRRKPHKPERLQRHKDASRLYGAFARDSLP